MGGLGGLGGQGATGVDQKAVRDIGAMRCLRSFNCLCSFFTVSGTWCVLILLIENISLRFFLQCLLFQITW